MKKISYVNNQLNQTVQSIPNKSKQAKFIAQKCPPNYTKMRHKMCPQYKYEAMGSTFQNLQHFDIADNADEYHQISEAAACKDEEADPEE